MLEQLLFQLLPIGVGVAALLPSLLRRRRRLRGWQDAAGVCGLQVLGTSGWGPQLTAQGGAVTVTLEARGDSTRIALRGPMPPSLYSVSIRREPLLRRTPEIEIGDPSFDSAFFIEGPMRDVLPLLDAELRGLMIRANQECRLQISTGMLVAELSDEMVIFLLPLLVDIGQRLAQPVDVLRRLTESAHHDPEPGVRLRAAQELGAEGRDVLLNLAEGLEDDACSARAVSLLGRELPFERTKAILDRALESRRAQTARACLEALRLQGASPGQLSLAGTEAGQLSLAQAETGQLSLAADPAGQLSLPPGETEQPSPGARKEPVRLV